MKPQTRGQRNTLPTPGSPQLVMVRETLNDLPPVTLPPGFSLRPYQPGSCLDWNRIISGAFAWENGTDYFEEKMRRDPAFRPERVLFIFLGQRAVATASAWHQPEGFPGTGILHFVAVDAACSGRGLGFQISLAALHHMKREGRGSARLLTDDHRLSAITTYLRLGFLPQIVHENQRTRWRGVWRELKLPGSKTRMLNTHLRMPVTPAPVTPATQRVDNCYGYLPLRRHNPLRENRGGPPGGGNPDFLADETLLKPSHAGTARCTVDRVLAGASVGQGLTFSFQVGARALERGAEVHWLVRGQGALGFRGQGENPEGDNYVRLEGTAEAVCRVAPGAAWLRLQVEKGVLRPGQTVRLQFQNVRKTPANRLGYRWNPVAARRRIYVEVHPHPAEPAMRLPAPLEIHFLPGKPKRLEVTLPCTRRTGQEIRAQVTLRDRHDNRIEGFSGQVTLSRGGQPAGSLPMVAGRSTARLPQTAPTGPIRIEATCGVVSQPGRSNPCVTSEDLNYYIGDLHCHDLLSESEGYPDEVYTFARDDRALDFFSLSVQSHGWHSNEKHVLHKYFNERFLEEGHFVPLLAFEWQHSSYGDKVIHYLGGSHPMLPVEDSRFSTPAALYEALRATDALIISHHTAYPLPRWVPGTDWSVVENDIERCVEIWSCHGSSEGYDPADRPLRDVDPDHTAYAALRRGLRLGFVGGSDSHSGRPGGAVSEPGPHRGGLAAVWAPELTRRAIHQALFNRHTCALTGARIVVRMTVNGVLMGGEAPPSPHARVRIEVHAPGRIAKVEILKNTRLAKSFPVRGTDTVIEWGDQTRGPAFYHCRITQTDGELAVTSPVWIG